MNISWKLALLGLISLASSCALGGCGTSQSSAGVGFENAIRAPKGPMPPEARAAMEKAMASQNKNKPAGQP